MKVLIVMGHPAHVHFFRHYMKEMEDRGHEIMVCVKLREITTKLLDIYDIPYKTFGKTYPNQPAKAWGIVMNDLRLLNFARRFKPDLTASIGGLYSVHAGACLSVPSIDFMDTENATLTNAITFPLATVVATPDCYAGKVPSRKHRPYPGYHELAYLHPSRFSPDMKKLEPLGVGPRDYIVVRFSTLDASHQMGEAVLNQDEKIELVKELSSHCRVFVDCEGEMPKELDGNALKIMPHNYHHVLAFARLYVGEGATAASEAGVLGVPWIYISGDRRGYLDDQERTYGLGKTVKSKTHAIETVKELMKKTPSHYELMRKKLLNEKIDVTSWMVELSEEFL